MRLSDKVRIEPGREMPGWKEKDSEGLGALEDIYTHRRARVHTWWIVGWGGVGCRSRACEFPNGTHASFDKLWEHTYTR